MAQQCFTIIDLPEDVLLSVMDYFDQSSLYNLMTCTRWFHDHAKPRLYSHIVLNNWPSIEDNTRRLIILASALAKSDLAPRTRSLRIEMVDFPEPSKRILQCTPDDIQALLGDVSMLLEDRLRIWGEFTPGATLAFILFSIANSIEDLHLTYGLQLDIWLSNLIQHLHPPSFNKLRRLAYLHQDKSKPVSCAVAPFLYLGSLSTLVLDWDTLSHESCIDMPNRANMLRHLTLPDTWITSELFDLIACCPGLVTFSLELSAWLEEDDELKIQPLLASLTQGCRNLISLELTFNIDELLPAQISNLSFQNVRTFVFGRTCSSVSGVRSIQWNASEITVQDLADDSHTLPLRL